MDRLESLLEKANTLPLSPGVYIMKDKWGKVIYVGKSRKLKNRVSQYFQSSVKNLKTAKMVSLVDDFEYFLCDTEMEALTLENRLIKQHTPKYNIRLKDSKSYPYIKVTDGQYPKIMYSRKRVSDRAKYFGPYSGVSTVFSVIKLLEKTLGIPSCKRSFPRDIGKERPCIYYQMGQCVGLCTGKVSPEEYAETVKCAMSILRGNTAQARRDLEEQMLEFARREQFEAAARCRDAIAALEKLSEKQKVVASPDADRDVFALYSDEQCSCISVFNIREGAVTDKSEFCFGADMIAEAEEMPAFICDYYLKREYVPHEVLLSFDLSEEDRELMSAALCRMAARNVQLRTPERGELKALCDMVYDNAREKAKMYKIDAEKDDETLVRLASMLGLEVLPERIEAYDISNLASEHKTCGMVVMENGKLKKSDYRTFNIKSVEGTDDYASMREALQRRLSHLGDGAGSFASAPDLILLDGGKGHVSTVKAAMDEMGIDIPVFGMVKDDFHKTRALCDEEREISIARDKGVFSLVYRLQEEVHRFSVSKMEGAKRKTLTTSTLQKIDGIGEAKARAILKHFGGLAKVKTASADEIAAVKGISRADGKRIYEYFHKN